jgi:NifU-like protein involved in Fe-S cluster formation
MIYSKQIIKHFQKPHNQGVLKDADAVGQVGNAACGDVMKIYIKVGEKAVDKKKEQVIKDIRFETLGCAAAIAVSSALTVRVKGLPLDQALAVTKDDIVNDLGGMPAPKIHCSMLGIEALEMAIHEYRGKKKINHK